MAGELAISDVITISPDSSISESHALMEEEHISGLPVVENEKIVGIISRRDIQPILRAGAERKVSEIMTSDVVTEFSERTSHQVEETEIWIYKHMFEFLLCCLLALIFGKF